MRTMFPVFLACGLSACDLLKIPELTEPGNGSMLTPVTPFVGTWRNVSSPIAMEHQTDFCGQKETAMRSDWNVTWIITQDANDPNRANIKMQVAESNRRYPAASCADALTGYVPMPSSATDAVGIVSGTRISVRYGSVVVYEGSLTSDQMMGSWKRWECLLLCFGESSGQNKFNLFKR